MQEWIIQQGPVAGVLLFLLYKEYNANRVIRNGADPLNRLTEEVTNLTKTVQDHVLHDVSRHGEVLAAVEKTRTDILEKVGAQR